MPMIGMFYGIIRMYTEVGNKHRMRETLMERIDTGLCMLPNMIELPIFR